MTSAYTPNAGFADDNLGRYLRTGGLQIAPKSSVGSLWNPNWRNFGPRAGFAWYVFGDGKTSLRGGVGIGYERNFGNVTFNLIQNPPNYAVLDVAGPITTSNYGPLAGNTGTPKLPRVGARIVDPNIKTAYAHTWSASPEHQFGRRLVWSGEYSGSQGWSHAIVRVAGDWKISVGHRPGLDSALLGGWSLNPLFIARTGQPFSVFDRNFRRLPLNTPRASFNGSVPRHGNGLIATAPDTYQYLTFTPSQMAHLPMSLAPGFA